jgi:hypothetical protein
LTVETVDVDISGLAVRFEGLTPALTAELRREWRGYVREEPHAPSVVIRVEDDERAMTSSRFMEGGLHIEAGPGAVRFKRDEGELHQDMPGLTATARLAQGDPGRRFWGLVNLTSAAVGWRLLARGGGAMHAAGVLVEGRAFLLVGPSGCGKTTWARTAAGAGLPVLSDDCVLVDSAPGGLVALGSPFRSKDFPSPGPGRWPVAALLIPRPASGPSLAPVNRLMLEARIAANLLYSTAAWDAHAATAEAAQTIASGAPARILSFRPDASWIPLMATIEGAGDGAK